MAHDVQLALHEILFWSSDVNIDIALHQPKSGDDALRREILGTLVVVIIVAAILVVYFIAFNSPAVYQVTDENLTLHGEAAIVPCKGFNSAVCPSAGNASLYHVELVRYGGEDYYLSSYTEYPSGQSVECVGSSCVTLTTTASTYTVWFTNSTVYCISPAHPFTNSEHQNPTCPTSPYRTTTVIVPTPSVSSLDSAIGLRLNLSLASDPNGAIVVAVNDFNTLDHVNNITASNRWPMNQGGSAFWISGGSFYAPPLAYAILQGDYSLNNFTTGAPLSLEAERYGTTPYVAPTPYYAFNPYSDVATAYEPGDIDLPGAYYNVTVGSGGTVSGYWTGSGSQSGVGSIIGGACPGQASTIPIVQASSGCPLVLNQFLPGVYTVVAADEWGQVVLLHFTLQDD